MDLSSDVIMHRGDVHGEGKRGFNGLCHGYARYPPSMSCICSEVSHGEVITRVFSSDHPPKESPTRDEVYLCVAG